MTHYPAPQIVSDERRLLIWQNAPSVDAFLQTMRGLGANKGECMRALCALQAIKLGDAQRLVHLSAAWADRRENDEELQNAFCDALELLAKEDALIPHAIAS